MMHAIYTITEAPGMVALIDEGDHSICKTVTNDAEHVVGEILEHHGNVRIIYKDSLGDWAELGHDGHCFTGFKPCRLPNISFSLTTEQVRSKTKTVTRRLGWGHLVPGQFLMAVEKAQGLKKGQHPVQLGVIRAKAVRREQLKTLRTAMPPYGRRELVAEGFPLMTTWEFIMMFCNHNCCTPETMVTRIEFEYL